MLIEEEIDNFRKDFDQDKYFKVTEMLSKAKSRINFKSIYINNGEVIIKYLGTENIKSVYLVGDFTNWYSDPVELKNDGRDWTVKLTNMEIGVHYYKFIVDGEETLDVHNPFMIEEDGEINNIFIVSQPANVYGNRVSLSENVHYIGELKNGEPHGIGLLYYSENDIRNQAYGEFEDGVFCGTGTLYFESSNGIIVAYGNFMDYCLLYGTKIMYHKKRNLFTVDVGDFQIDETDESGDEKLYGNGKKIESDGISWLFISRYKNFFVRLLWAVVGFFGFAGLVAAFFP